MIFFQAQPRRFFWTNAPEELIDQADQVNLVDWLKTGHMRSWGEADLLRHSRRRSVVEDCILLVCLVAVGAFFSWVMAWFTMAWIGAGLFTLYMIFMSGVMIPVTVDICRELRAHRAEQRIAGHMHLDVTAFVNQVHTHLDTMRRDEPRKLGCYKRFVSEEWRREVFDAVISENLERVRLFMEEEAASTKAPSPIVQAFRDDLLKAVDREVNVLLSEAAAALNAQETERRDAEREQRRRYRVMEAERAAQRELAAQQADGRAKRMVAYLGLGGCNTEQAAELLRMEADLNQTAEESPADSATATS